jgi:hypothetical protein
MRPIFSHFLLGLVALSHAAPFSSIPQVSGLTNDSELKFTTFPERQEPGIQVTHVKRETAANDDKESRVAAALEHKVRAKEDEEAAVKSRRNAVLWLDYQEEWLQYASPGVKKYFRSENGLLKTLEQYRAEMDRLYDTTILTHDKAEARLRYLQTGVEHLAGPVVGRVTRDRKIIERPGLADARITRQKTRDSLAMSLDNLITQQRTLMRYYKSQRQSAGKTAVLENNIRKAADEVVAKLKDDEVEATNITDMLESVVKGADY